MTKIGIDLPPPLRLDDDALKRIVDAAGERLICDKKFLRIDLQELGFTYWYIVSDEDRGHRKSHKNKLVTIRKAAVQISFVLKNNPNIWRCDIFDTRTAFSSQDSEKGKPDNHYKEELISTMDRVVDDVDRCLDVYHQMPSWRVMSEARGEHPKWIRILEQRSPFEQLAGARLPRLFSDYFGMDATFHRSAVDGKPDGPFIRFAEQAMAELRIAHRGRPYSREAIAKALTDIRSGRVRRKLSGRRGPGARSKSGRWTTARQQDPPPVYAHSPEAPWGANEILRSTPWTRGSRHALLTCIEHRGAGRRHEPEHRANALLCAAEDVVAFMVV